MFTKDKTKEKRRPCQKEARKKPGTIWLANQTNKALIIKVKSPKVRKFIGKVKIIKIGLITVFKTPNTTTKKTAVKKSANLTPGKREAVIKTAIVLKSRLKNIAMALIAFWLTAAAARAARITIHFSSPPFYLLIRLPDVSSQHSGTISLGKL